MAGAPKGNKNAVGNKGGHPRKVAVADLPALGVEMVEWFTKHQDNLVTSRKIPFFSRFAREVVGCTQDTIGNYRDEDESFAESYLKCKEIQKEILIEGGLNGIFNPTAFIFTSKNITDMRDKKELEHSGKLSLASIFDASTDHETE